jgi:methyl-accepting chemotaxis protein
MPESLEATLRRLHDELGKLDTLNASEREQLKIAIDEIQDSLNRFDIRSADLAKRFHQSTQEAANKHPQLTQTAGQFADMLSQMGI